MREWKVVCYLLLTHGRRVPLYLQLCSHKHKLMVDTWRFYPIPMWYGNEATIDKRVSIKFIELHKLRYLHIPPKVSPCALPTHIHTTSSPFMYIWPRWRVAPPCTCELSWHQDLSPASAARTAAMPPALPASSSALHLPDSPPAND